MGVSDEQLACMLLNRNVRADSDFASFALNLEDCLAKR